jgi:hypothetical protein
MISWGGSEWKIEVRPSLQFGARQPQSRLALAILLTAVIWSDCNDQSFPPSPDPSPPYTQVDFSPAWSPDGATIAYHRLFPSSSGPPGIYAISSDGSDNRILVERTIIGRSYLRFAPNAESLVFLDGDLFSFNIATLDVRQLTSTNGEAGPPDWSPDGHFLIYTRSTELYIIELSSGLEHPILSNGLPVIGWHPRWSPAGEPIAFMTDGGEQHSDIYTVRSDGVNLRRVTNSVATNSDAAYPQWIDGGANLLYLRRPRDPNVPASTQMIRLDGTDERQFPVTLWLDDALSPDAQAIVSPGPQDPEIWVLFLHDFPDSSAASRQLTFFLP